MTEEFNRNFEFLYFGRNRHVTADLEILDKPIKTLEELGGIGKINFSIHGTDHEGNHHRGSSYEFRIFEFEEHTFKVYMTREERPQHPEHPTYLTRLRISNYDLSDDLVKKVSENLSQLPKSD